MATTKVTLNELRSLIKQVINEKNELKHSQYKDFGIIFNDEHFEIKGYSMNSGTFFQSVDTVNINDVKKVIDLAIDRNNDKSVKKVFPIDYYDIHKRIVYFSDKF